MGEEEVYEVHGDEEQMYQQEVSPGQGEEEYADYGEEDGAEHMEMEGEDD